MALFPVSSNVVQIQTASPTSSDQFSNGVRLKSDASAVFVATSGGGQVSNGLLLDANGAVICVDATSGLPAGVQYVNGLPVSTAGALCVSSNAVDEWINGLPFDANGALATSGLAATDPFYANVSLLLHFDGTNGSTTFTDNSPSPKTPNVVGDFQINTAEKLFGTGSGLADGTGDALWYATNTAFDFGSGDFTVEVAWKPTVSNTNQIILYYGNDTGTGQNTDISWSIAYLGALGGVVRFSGAFGTSSFNLDTIAAINTTIFNRMRVTRVGNVFYIFLNGNLEASTTQAVTLNSPTLRILQIGQYLTTNRLFNNGRYDELRITKGVGRSTASYTVDTAAFPNS